MFLRRPFIWKMKVLRMIKPIKWEGPVHVYPM